MSRAADDADEELIAKLGLGRSGARRRVVRWAILLLVACGIAAAIYYGVQGAANPPLTYRTEEARRGDLTVTVTATGTLQPRNQVDVGSEISGRLRTVAVDYNDRVTAGQTLAELDTDLLDAQVLQSQASLDSAEATVREAEATLAEARANASRMETLAGRNIASSQDLDATRAAAARAEAAVAVAQAQVRLAEAAHESDIATRAKAVIRSPIDGLVISRNIEPGQTVVASLQAPVLFTLAEDLARMELHLDVDEADIGQIAAEQAAQFSVDAYPNRRFDAMLTEVRVAPRSTQGVVTYEVLLAVDNPGLLLFPGMTATADITTLERADAVLVPNGALRFTPLPEDGAPEAPEAAAADERVVWVLDNGTPAPVVVTIGISDGRVTEVLEGRIEPGTSLIVDIVRPE